MLGNCLLVAETHHHFLKYRQFVRQQNFSRKSSIRSHLSVVVGLREGSKKKRKKKTEKVSSRDSFTDPLSPVKITCTKYSPSVLRSTR